MRPFSLFVCLLPDVWRRALKRKSFFLGESSATSSCCIHRKVKQDVLQRPIDGGKARAWCGWSPFRKAQPEEVDRESRDEDEDGDAVAVDSHAGAFRSLPLKGLVGTTWAASRGKNFVRCIHIPVRSKSEFYQVSPRLTWRSSLSR